MKKLKRFGFFDSVALEQRKAQLSQLIGEGEHGQKAKILSYLRSGEELLLVAGIVRDPIDPKRPIIGSPHILTDGTWAWSADVAYYVEKYNLRIPEEFVEAMKSNSWRVPKVADLQLLEF
jgi:hypothetical protein